MNINKKVFPSYTTNSKLNIFPKINIFYSLLLINEMLNQDKFNAIIK